MKLNSNPQQGITSKFVYQIHHNVRDNTCLTCGYPPSVQAGQVMGKYVCFFQPVEKVGVVYDFLKSTDHSVFPVVDKENNNILFGTIDRHALIMLLKLRSFGNRSKRVDSGVLSNFIEAHGQTFVPIAGYEQVEKALPDKPSVVDLRVSEKDRSCVLDLRPYTNQSPISIQESTSVAVSLFRARGKPCMIDTLFGGLFSFSFFFLAYL